MRRIGLTAHGVRDRIRQCRNCKHPIQQRDMLFTLLEDIVESQQAQEIAHCDALDNLAESHRAECADLERRYNERIEALASAVKYQSKPRKKYS